MADVLAQQEDEAPWTIRSFMRRLRSRPHQRFNEKQQHHAAIEIRNRHDSQDSKIEFLPIEQYRDWERAIRSLLNDLLQRSTAGFEIISVDADDLIAGLDAAFQRERIPLDTYWSFCPLPCSIRMTMCELSISTSFKCT